MGAKKISDELLKGVKRRKDEFLYKNMEGKRIPVTKGTVIPDDAGGYKGTDYYLLSLGRPKRGKKKYSGEELWDLAMKYFTMVDANPAKEMKVFGSGVSTSIDKPIPYTQTGFCVYAGITAHAFDSYKNLSKKEDVSDDDIYLAEVANRIREIMITQKIEGAASGIFQHQIIALDLGLVAKKRMDKIEHDATKMSEEEIKKLNTELEKEY